MWNKNRKLKIVMKVRDKEKMNDEILRATNQ